MRHRFSFLFTYVLFCLLGMDLALFAVRFIIPRAYPFLYWILELLSVCLRFCVIWEVFRHTFPSGSLRDRIPSKELAVPYFWILLVSLSTFSWFGAYTSFHSHFVALECSLGCGQGLLMLSLLLIARHFGFPMGRNVWGLAVGFGAYVSINIVAFAAFEMDRSFLSLYQTIVAVAFDAMLAIWTWALWTYAPNPRTSIEPAEVRSEELDWWARRWEKTLGAVRKVVNP